MDTKRINVLSLVGAIVILASSPVPSASQVPLGAQPASRPDGAKTTYQTILDLVARKNADPTTGADVDRMLRTMRITPDEVIGILDGLTSGRLCRDEDDGVMSDFTLFLSLKVADQPAAVNASLVELVRAVRLAHIRDAEKVRFLDALFGPPEVPAEKVLPVSEELLALVTDTAASADLRAIAAREAWQLLDLSSRKIAFADPSTAAYVRARASTARAEQRDIAQDVGAAIRSGDLRLTQATANQIRGLAAQKNLLRRAVQGWMGPAQRQPSSVQLGGCWKGALASWTRYAWNSAPRMWPRASRAPPPPVPPSVKGGKPRLQRAKLTLPPRSPGS